ncbi:MAG: NADH-quinone oxidoreductase subunit J [Gammaproteobacteria bacterium]|nr:NADH-quinone oxidoreductase subunit J [Gammaproteobacteria bacterium]
MIVQAIFYFFAAVLVLSAALVITVRNPVHAALFLVLAFFSSAAIWLLLEAEFLAIALVLVYVGAVMVLFLFVVMMLDINLAPLREGFARYLPLGIAVALLMAVAMGLVVASGYFDARFPPRAGEAGPAASNTLELGHAMYTDFLYPFEIAGAILLVAIIAAIALTMRKPRTLKTPRPEKQIVARREERVRLVKMEAEKR